MPYIVLWFLHQTPQCKCAENEITKHMEHDWWRIVNENRMRTSIEQARNAISFKRFCHKTQNCLRWCSWKVKNTYHLTIHNTILDWFHILPSFFPIFFTFISLYCLPFESMVPEDSIRLSIVLVLIIIIYSYFDLFIFSVRFREQKKKSFLHFTVQTIDFYCTIYSQSTIDWKIAIPIYIRKEHSKNFHTLNHKKKEWYCSPRWNDELNLWCRHLTECVTRKVTKPVGVNRPNKMWTTQFFDFFVVVVVYSQYMNCKYVW